MMLSMVSDVSAMLVARTTLRAPGGVGMNIFACMSLGRFAYTGRIMSSLSFVPNLLTLSWKNEK